MDSLLARMSTIAYRQITCVTRVWASLFLLFVGAGAVLAQDGSLAPCSELNVPFRHLDVSGTVLATTQDADGLIWLATGEGLARFDGQDLRYFRDHTEGVVSPAGLVYSVAPGADGKLYVGSTSGFHRTLSGGFEALPRGEAAGGESWIVDTLLPREHDLLVASADGALYAYDPLQGLLEAPAWAARLPAHARVEAMAQNESGEVVLATYDFDSGSSNLFRLRGGELERLNLAWPDRRQQDVPVVTTIFADRDNSFWLGTPREGLIRIQTAAGTNTARVTAQLTVAQSAAHPAEVTAILRDSVGRLWVGTRQQGLAVSCSESEGFLFLEHDPASPRSLSSSEVFSLFEDRGGVLWVGTSRGVNYWWTGSRGISHYRRSEGGSSDWRNRTTSFAMAPDGDLWVASFAGVVRFDPVAGRVVEGSELLVDQPVAALHNEASGALWIATLADGLHRLDTDTGTLRAYRHDPSDPNSLSSDNLTTLELSRDGKGLYVGTYGAGLNYLAIEQGKVPDGFKHFRANPDADQTTGPSPDLPSDYVLMLFEDSSESLWIGTDGAGLARFDKALGTFVSFTEGEGRGSGLPSNLVVSMAEGPQGDLWLGTETAGLVRIRKASRGLEAPVFERFTTAHGLPSMSLVQVLADDWGKVWMSTGKGLSVLDPVDGSVRNLDATHGLQTEPFITGAGLRTRDGALFFGGLDGWNVIDGAGPSRNQNLPEVLFTQITLLDRPLLSQPKSNPAEIRLDYDDKILTFEFTATDFAAPERNLYRYKLEGFDDQWRDAGAQRSATYTNLEAGRYTFRVKAANNDGLWNERGASVALVAHPPFWKSAGGLLALRVGGLHGRAPGALVPAKDPGVQPPPSSREQSSAAQGS